MAVIILGAGACRTGRRGGGTGPISIHLNNDLVPPSSITVYLVGPSAQRRLIGTVPPSEHRVLRFPWPGHDQYRLVAERDNGRGVRSEPFTLTSGGEVIDWELQLNSMWFPQDEQ